MNLNKIIIGLDSNETYWGILPLTYRAWKKFFPDATFILAFVGGRKALRIKVAQYCDQFSPYDLVKGIPSCNLAKLARFYEAAKYNYATCMINDVDLIPLQKEYYYNKLQERKLKELLCIGTDVYKGTPHEDKFPLGYLTGEGVLFRDILKINERDWNAFAKSFIGHKKIDEKEDISKPFKKFSDESLIRALLKTYHGKIRNSNRNFTPGKRSIARHASLNLQHLLEGKHIEAHHLIPVSKQKEKIKAIAEYLEIDFDFDWMYK